MGISQAINFGILVCHILMAVILMAIKNPLFMYTFNNFVKTIL